MPYEWQKTATGRRYVRTKEEPEKVVIKTKKVTETKTTAKKAPADE